MRSRRRRFTISVSLIWSLERCTAQKVSHNFGAAVAEWVGHVWRGLSVIRLLKMETAAAEWMTCLSSTEKGPRLTGGSWAGANKKMSTICEFLCVSA